MSRWTVFCITALAACLAACGRANAESAIPLLSGFDTERIDAAYPPTDDDSAGELAKLLYRLRSVDINALESRIAEPGSENQLGDAVRVDGLIREIKALQVPSRLVEFLEMSRMQLLVVASGDSEVRVVTTSLPNQAKPGDRVSGAAVAIELDSSLDARVSAVASPHLRWFPASPPSVGWQLLSESGVDISLLAEVGTRDRRPLLAEDGDAFYSMLAAAAEVAGRGDLPTPQLVDPVTLLRQRGTMGGQWLRMNLETVQVTRIAVENLTRQSQLGSDHYFQIDAVGDLGNVVIKLEPPPGEDGPPAIFESRYPVSIVVRELPEFLKQRIRAKEGGDAVVSQIRLMVGVDVFFFRLWSYQSDFMNKYGSGKQFGPLLIAAQIRNREPTSSDPAGVAVIAWLVAVAVISAIIATWWWNRRLAAQDVEVRDRRKDRESQQLQLP